MRVKENKKGDIKNRLAFVVVILVLGFLGFLPCVMATPLSLDTSVPVLMIDGTGDADELVEIGVSDTSSSFDFGYIEETTFTSILIAGGNFTTKVFNGGDVVDFAIKDTGSGDAITLSGGTADMYFSGDIAAANSENPVVPFDYWQNLTITWTVGNNDFTFNVGGGTDGFAPVPDASIMFLLGPALLCLGMLGRRKFKNGE